MFKRGNKRVQGSVRPVPSGRIEVDNANEMCYKICATCTCDVAEQLNCCEGEQPEDFKGCVVTNALQLCNTARPVNACCR